MRWRKPRVDRAQDPQEALDESYDHQLALLNEVRRGLAAVVTARKQLEAHAAHLRAQAGRFEQQAREALTAGDEPAARRVLERRAVALGEAGEIEAEAATLQARQDELAGSQEHLANSLRRFRIEKAAMKANYNVAKAMVEIGEAATGLGQRMADVGLAVQRAHDRTEELQARAEAIDELIAAGTLESPGAQTTLQRELAAISSDVHVDDELERLKSETP
jgi:phage shock protein A